MSSRIEETLQAVMFQLKEMSNDSNSAMHNAYRCFEQIYPTLEGFVKMSAIGELADTLGKPDHNKKEINLFKDHEKAVTNFNAQMDKGLTKSILIDKDHKRRSKLELGLKIASVVSILAGVGIITTGFLMAKRFHDSGHTSINFFKSLSQNIHEGSTKVVKSVIKPK